LTYRELFWASESRLRADWQMTSSIVRVISTAFNGKEPPLTCYVPARFRPQLVKSAKTEYTPEARRQIVGAFIDALHGRPASVS
jgi:hypothetical protein